MKYDIIYTIASWIYSITMVFNPNPWTKRDWLNIGSVLLMTYCMYKMTAH